MRANKAITNVTKKAKLFLAALLLLGTQAFAPISLLISATASAAPVCVIDTGGANDLSGQKDLNKLCVDYANVPTTIATIWNWDETGTNGANTMDACNLFDTDGDGNANYAVCVTTQNDPASLQSTTTYSCTDTKTDRCTSSASISNGTTSCTVSQVTNDPFPGPPNSAKGDSYPKDTQSSCTIQLSAVGGASAKLIDVCSYPSAQPNSAPSDCVIARSNAGKVELIKDLVPNADAGLFNLTIDGPGANDTTTVNNVGDNGTTGQVVVGAGSVVVKETPGTNTSLTSYNTTIICKDLHGTGSIVGQISPNGSGSRQLTFTLADQADVICVITNTRQQATLILQKTVTNDDGGTLTQSNFPVAIGGTTAQWGSNTVAPGTYTVSETQQPGYSAGSWGGSCTAGGSVTIADGETKTCTITNNDVAGQMKVVKQVTNDNGGNAVAGDFTLSVNGQPKTQNQYFSANVGTYTVTESGPSGYVQTSLSCVDDTTHQTVAHPVSLGLSQSVTCTVINNDIAPQLTVIKHVVNDNGGTKAAGDFTLNVTGTNVSTSSFAGVESPGTTVTLNAGSYSVDENAVTGYAKSLGANCSGTIAVGQSKTCTVTNDDIAPILTLIKYVINDNGGLLQIADFPLFINGGQVTSGLPNVLNAGAYTATETNKPGYTAGNWGGDCAANGTITLLLGDVKSCSITNDDQPGTLIVKKVVTNNNGGNKTASDFSFSVNGGSTIGFEADGQNDFTVNAGTYTITETTPTGYSVSYDNCNQVAVANGETEICTITNDDVAPKLTLVKYVTNDNGGNKQVSDFPLFVSGNPVTSGVKNTLSANTLYTATETNLAGYTPSSWSGDCATDGTITLQPGDDKTCYITNDDQAAQLTVIKHVVNDNGGTKSASNFTMNVTGTNVSDDSFPGNEGGTTVTLHPGSYGVDEDAVYGYAKTLGENCSGTIALGEHKYCTITNDDIQPKLTVTKVVTNDNGGNKQVSDFPLFVGASGVTSGAQNGFNAGAYVVSETQASGYAGSISGDCDTNGNVTLNVGDVKSCTITNNDVAPKLTIVKYVTNDNGGNAVVADFPLFINGNQVTSGVKNTLSANTLYTATETGKTGYTASSWSGDCSESGTITLQPGDDKTCYITNNDVAPTLTLIKNVVKDNGGTAGANDFGLTIGGTSVDSGETKTVNANTPIAINEAGLAGYQFVSITGDAKCPSILGGTVTLNEGDNVTCTITNDDISPTLTLIKWVTNNNGGLLKVSDFLLYVDAINVTSGVSNLFNAGAYLVNEINKPGYTASDWSGDCDATGHVTLVLGQNYTCEITNDDQPAKIKVTKVVVNDNGGEAKVGDFTLKVNDTTVTSGETNEFDGNTSYTISENDMPYGYVQTSITCVDTTAEATVANPFVTELGHNYECTVTNDDVAPTLTIKKKIKTVNETEQEFSFTSDFGNFNLAGGASTVLTDEETQVGEYTVSEVAAGGWKLNKIVCWGTKNYDVTDGSVAVTLEAGDNVTCKFVNEELSSITGSKFEDVNFDGEWSEDEPSLEGWTITLAELCEGEEEAVICEGSEKTIATDENGDYSFNNLESGYYVVCEEQQDGWVQTYPWWTEDGCHYIELGGEGDTEYADFRNFELGRVEGVKFNDINGNGKRDEGEPTLKNWGITLTKKCVVEAIDFRTDAIALPEEECEDEVKTVTTGATGAYSFGDLLPGDYTICEIQQANWKQTAPQTEDGCYEFTVSESGQVFEDKDFGNKAKPQVLSETTLVNTGSAASTSLLVGLVILSVLGTLHLLARRKSYQN